jgi:hypothetical protein
LLGEVEMHIMQEDLLGGDAMKFRRAFRPAAGLAWALSLSLALGFLPARPAEAVLWAPYDLNSLALLAEHIFLAREIEAREVEKDRTLRTFEIEKVYKGSLRTMEKVRVLDDYSRKHDFMGGPPVPEKFDPQVVLFLAPWSRWSSWPKTLKAEDRPQLEIVHSELRLLKDGIVYDFHQGMNPGRPVPRLQKKKPYSGEAAPENLAGLEEAIHEAVSCVKRYKELREEKDAKVRREGILALLDGYKEEAQDLKRMGFSEWHLSGQSSPFLRKIVDDFFASDDMEGVLEFIDRTGRVGEFRIEARKFLKSATRGDIPARLRTTAIWAIDCHCYGSVEAIRGLANLIGDPDPEIRDAAAKKLRRLRRLYTKYKREDVPEVTQEWEKALPVLRTAEKEAAAGKGSEK